MVSIPRGGCHGNPIVNGHEVVLDVKLDIAGRGERPKDFSLWVWSYCDNSDLFLAWTVVPKDSVRCRCGLFSISLKNFLPFRTFEGCELMGLQTGWEISYNSSILSFVILPLAASLSPLR